MKGRPPLFAGGKQSSGVRAPFLLRDGQGTPPPFFPPSLWVNGLLPRNKGKGMSHHSSFLRKVSRPRISDLFSHFPSGGRYTSSETAVCFFPSTLQPQIVLRLPFSFLLMKNNPLPGREREDLLFFIKISSNVGVEDALPPPPSFFSGAEGRRR